MTYLFSCRVQGYLSCMNLRCCGAEIVEAGGLIPVGCDITYGGPVYCSLAFDVEVGWSLDIADVAAASW